MEAKRRPIKVLCVDDSIDVVEVLRMHLRADDRFEDVGALDGVEGLEEEVERLRPDVVLMDLTMPGPPPLQAIRSLATRSPWCRPIAFSGNDDEQTRLAATRAGAAAFVPKNADISTILSELYRIVTEPK